MTGFDHPCVASLRQAEKSSSLRSGSELSEWTGTLSKSGRTGCPSGPEYAVEQKTSALRVKGTDAVDFHVDVVPGRFIDESNEDAFQYRASGEKCRLKTNIKTHIAHVKGSGVTDVIKIMKLWRTRNGVQLKTFVVELLTIDVLKGSTASLDKQVREVLEKLRDEPEDITVRDPANPSGNDLSEIWNESIRSIVSAVAKSSLAVIDSAGWEAVFGRLPDEESEASTVEGLRQAARAVSMPVKPWRHG